VVTLTSTYGQYEFKILDPVSLVTLFDSSSIEAFTLDSTSSYWKRAELTFGNNANYYIVVYCPIDATPKGTYTITAGERRLYNTSQSLTVSSARVTQGEKCTIPFNIQTPTGEPGYVQEIIYRAKDAAWSYEGGYYEVLTPGASRWRSNPMKFYRAIDFNFDDLNTPLVRADGEWKLRFTADKTGTYPGATINLYYHYEV